ncbi:MAG: GTP 3',8-cyclase MoaA [Flavobacteriales bacterium]
MEGRDEHLEDNFGRTHEYLRIALTEKCNFRCFYCMPAEGLQLSPADHLMKAEEIEEIVKIFVEHGVNKVRFTGGEPLIRKDFRDILKRLSKLPVELAITTNGVLVDKYIDDFKRYGLNSVNISMDSLNRESFKRITRRDNFDKVKKNVKLLLQSDFNVKLNNVVMKGENDNEIYDFVKLTLMNPLEVKFIEFMPFDGNEWEWEKARSSEELLKLIQDYFPGQVEKLDDKKKSTASKYKIAGAEGAFGFISTVSEPFCSSCNRLRITADGKMKNCLFSQKESDLLESYRKGEDIRPKIFQNVKMKEKMRGGMDTFDKFSNDELNSKNRSMITIGG